MNRNQDQEIAAPNPDASTGTERRWRPSLRLRGLAVLAVAVAGTWATGALVLERHAREQNRDRVLRDVEHSDRCRPLP